MFIDAFYEEDLMTHAGVIFIHGRERGATYGEDLNETQKKIKSSGNQILSKHLFYTVCHV